MCHTTRRNSYGGAHLSTKQHKYEVDVVWTGTHTGKASYTAYGREHELSNGQAPLIPGTADPAFRGHPDRWNPEQLQVAALSQCHMLWYLNLAVTAGVIVTDYKDHSDGVMIQDATGAGQFDSVTLRPHVTITSGSDFDTALQIHSKVPDLCFIARSVNFPVIHKPVITVQDDNRRSAMKP